MSESDDETSWASSPSRRRNMRAIRSQDTDTVPELAIRQRPHAAGLRYRVGIRPVPTLRRTEDVVFTRQQIAVLVDGCFWHGCPDHGRRLWQHNVDYWPDKIARNRERDEETNQMLKESGWSVLRFWEHEDPDAVAATVIAAVSAGQNNC